MIEILDDIEKDDDDNTESSFLLQSSSSLVQKPSRVLIEEINVGPDSNASLGKEAVQTSASVSQELSSNLTESSGSPGGMQKLTELSSVIGEVTKLSDDNGKVEELSGGIREISELSNVIREVAELSDDIGKIVELSGGVEEVTELSNEIEEVTKLCVDIGKSLELSDDMREVAEPSGNKGEVTELKYAEARELSSGGRKVTELPENLADITELHSREGEGSKPSGGKEELVKMPGNVKGKPSASFRQERESVFSGSYGGSKFLVTELEDDVETIIELPLDKKAKNLITEIDSGEIIESPTEIKERPTGLLHSSDKLFSCKISNDGVLDFAASSESEGKVEEVELRALDEELEGLD